MIRCRVSAVIVALTVLMVSVSAFAAPTDAPALGKMTLMDMMAYGGLLMWVIAAISVFTVACVLYGLFMLTDRHVAPDALRQQIVQLLRTGAVGEVRRVVESRSCSLSSVVIRVLEYLRDDPELMDTTRLKDVMETEGARQTVWLQSQQQYLMDIVGLAPLVGLLGTVCGMLKAFSSVHALASNKPDILIEGISMALLNTAFGLIVAIPAMIFHSLFRRKSMALIATLERASSDVFAACQHLRSK
jgi:biopolymer transport protein ExbB